MSIANPSLARMSASKKKISAVCGIVMAWFLLMGTLFGFAEVDWNEICGPCAKTLVKTFVKSAYPLLVNYTSNATAVE
jgi:hypothetical protein